MNRTSIVQLAVVIIGSVLFAQAVGGALTCTFELSSQTCSSGTKILGVQNDTGGVNNAHAEVTGSSGAWWNTSYTYRLNMSIANLGVTGTATNETVLVRLNSSNFDYSHALSTGGDIRFVDDDGSTILAYEIERWNTSGTSYVWVRIPSLNTAVATEYFTMYYGNSAVGSAQNASDTWDAKFKFVTHFNGSITGTMDVIDSSRNSNNGSTINLNSSNKVGDVINGAVNNTNATGAPGAINLSYPTSMEVGNRAFYWEFLYRKNSSNSDHFYFVDKRNNTGGGVGYELRETSAGLFFRVDEGAANQDAGVNTTYAATDTNYHHLRAGRNSTHVVICIDGGNCNVTADGTVTNISNPLTNITLLNHQLLGATFIGVVDEMRLAVSSSSSGMFSPNSLRVQNASLTGNLLTYGSEGVYSSMNNSLCCTADVTLATSCGTTFLKLSGTGNAHVQQSNYSDYTSSACLSGSSATTTCEYSDTSCSTNYDCVLSIANADGSGEDGTNAHVANCSTYTRKVCCRVKPYSVCINETGTCYQTITAALAAASAQQTIVITDNETYNETATLDITKSLRITSNATLGIPTVTVSNDTVISITTGSISVNISKINISAKSATDNERAVIVSATSSSVRLTNAIISSNLSGSNAFTVVASGTGTSLTINETNVTENSSVYVLMAQSSARLIVDLSNIKGRGGISFPSGTAYFDISRTMVNSSGTYSIAVDIGNITNVTVYGAYVSIGDTSSSTACYIADSYIESAIALDIDDTTSCIARNLTIVASSQAITVGQYATSNTTGIIIADTNVSGTSTRIYYDVSGVTDAFRNVTVVNSTITPSHIGVNGVNGNDTLITYFQNYLDLYVNYTDGNAVSSAIVTVANNTSTTVVSTTTASNGSISRQNVTYVAQSRNSTATTNTYTDNHLVTANAGGTTNYTTVNMSTNQNLTLTLDRLSVCVRETGYCWSTINDAIANATAGQTVVVTNSAVYSEAIVINRSLTLTSNGSAQPTINNSNNASVNSALRIYANSVNVSNLLFTSTVTIDGSYTIQTNGSSNRLQNISVVVDVDAQNHHVLGLSDTADSFVLNNVSLYNNDTAQAESSVLLYLSADNGVVNNSAFTTLTGSATPLELVAANGNTFQNNSFNRSWTSNGITIEFTSNPGSSGDSDNTMDATNTVNGKPVLYITNNSWDISNASSYGAIVLSTASNITLRDDTYDGEFISADSNVNFTRMVLRNNYSLGIHSLRTGTWTFRNTTIDFRTPGSDVNGLYLEDNGGTETLTFSNVTMHVNGSTSQGIFAENNFNNINISNSNLNFSIGNNYGIEFTGAAASGEFYLTNSTVTCSASADVLFLGDPGYIDGSTFTLTGCNIAVIATSDPYNFTNLTISGSGTAAGSFDAILFADSGTAGNAIYFRDVDASITGGAVPFFQSERGIAQFINSTLSSTNVVFSYANSNAAYTTLYNLTNVTWDNSSYSFATCTPAGRRCNITANWYIDSQVNDSVNGLQLSGATIAAISSGNETFTSVTANTSGQMIQWAKEYSRNNSGISYFTNTTVAASMSRYLNSSTSVNLTGNAWINFTLNPDVPTQGTPLLNTTDYTLNGTDQTLTCTNRSTTDANGDTVSNIYVWTINGNRTLAAYWPFDTNLSITRPNATRDYAGDDNNGTLGNGSSSNVPTWITSGKVGGAYRFNDSREDVIVVQNFSHLSDFTIMLWFKPSESTSASRTVLQYNPDFEIQIVSNGSLRARVNSTSNAGFLWSPGNYWSDVAASYWNAVALSYNSSSGIQKLYINGTLVDNLTLTHGTFTGDNYLTIGNGQLFSSGFNGSIDDLRIYNRTLTAEQIYQIYVEGNNSINTSTTVNNETKRGEVWSCSVYGNDNLGDSAVGTSISVSIRNTLPTHSTPLLNSSPNNLNRSNSNLTCYNQSTIDVDVDAVTNLFTWSASGTRYEYAYYPFDSNTTNSTAGAIRDYAGDDQSGTIGNVTPAWNASGARGGAYQSTGTGYTVWMGDIDTLDNPSIVLWFYPGLQTNDSQVLAKGEEFDVTIVANGSLRARWNTSATNTLWHHFNYTANGTKERWYQLVMTYNSTTDQQFLYINGTLVDSGTFAGVRANTTANFTVGMYNGSLDEVRLFNRTLSPEQVYQMWLEVNNSIVTSTILANETVSTDVWECEVTPNDKFADGETLFSNNLSIIGTIPNVPTLNYPLAANTTVFERYTYFAWNGSDNQSDSLTYYINISAPAGCAAIAQQTVDTDYYTSTDKLCVDQVYNWTVQACDLLDGCSAFAPWQNFTIASVVGITMVNNGVLFGNLQASIPGQGTSANTTTNSPSPLTYNNTGNVDTLVTTKADAALWSVQPLNTSYFQYTDENGSVWSNYDSAYTALLSNLSYQAVPRELEILVTVPEGEPPGSKNTTITVLGASLE